MYSNWSELTNVKLPVPSPLIFQIESLKLNLWLWSKLRHDSVPGTFQLTLSSTAVLQPCLSLKRHTSSDEVIQWVV